MGAPARLSLQQRRPGAERAAVVGAPTVVVAWWRTLWIQLAVLSVLPAASSTAGDGCQDHPEWAEFCSAAGRAPMICKAENALAQYCVRSCCVEANACGRSGFERVCSSCECGASAKSGAPAAPDLDGEWAGDPERADMRRWIISVPKGSAGTDAELLDLLAGMPSEASLVYQGQISQGGCPILVISATDEQMRDTLLHGDFPTGTVVETDVYFHVDDDDDPPDVADALSTESDEPARRLSLPWHLDRIDDRRGTDSSYETLGAQDGSGANVYVMDTGIRTTHSEFGGRAIPAIDVSARGRVDVCSPTDTNCAYDVRGHGTHVAGTVGGATYGVARGATLHAVKVLDDNGWGELSWIVQGFNWLAANAAHPAIVSASVGKMGAYTSVTQSVQAATEVGLNIVVAGGNQNSDACSFTPPNIAAAIAVGSTDENDVRAGFSNFGACVDIFAPGRDIISAGVATDEATAWKSGTSMSAPIVSGALALMRGSNPSLTEQDAKDLLFAKATPDIVGDARGAANLFVYIGHQGDTYTTLTDTTMSTASDTTTSATSATTTVTDSPPWEWRSVGHGYCRDESCLDRHTCSNKYEYVGQCVALEQCQQSCENDASCVGFAWSPTPLDTHNGCSDVGLSRCVLYMDADGVGSPATTKQAHSEYTCYIRQTFCRGRTIADGSRLSNHYPCTCGAATCYDNELCDEDSGTCTPTQCSVTDGRSLSSTYPCTCGETVCSENEVCEAASISGSKPSGTCTLRACSGLDGLGASSSYPCACGSDVCSWNHVCDEPTSSCIRVVLTEGMCDYPIVTLDGCSLAAAALWLSEAAAVDDEQSGASWDPPYCYLEGGVLKFNAAGDNAGACSASDRCICGTGVTTTTTATTSTATFTTLTSSSGTSTSVTSTSMTSTSGTGTSSSASSTVTSVEVRWDFIGEGRCQAADGWTQTMACARELDECKELCLSQKDCVGISHKVNSCYDSMGEGVNLLDAGCSAYWVVPSWCSYRHLLDDADFTSADMCCACGGGAAPECGVNIDESRCVLHIAGGGSEEVLRSATSPSDAGDDYGCHAPLAQYEAYRVVDSGECDWPFGPILSRKECMLAAEELALEGSSLTVAEASGHAPPFCYYEGGQLKFNADVEHSGNCSTSQQCLCGAPTTTITSSSTASTGTFTSSTTATTGSGTTGTGTSGTWTSATSTGTSTTLSSTTDTSSSETSSTKTSGTETSSTTTASTATTTASTSTATATSTSVSTTSVTTTSVTSTSVTTGSATSSTTGSSTSPTSTRSLTSTTDSSTATKTTTTGTSSSTITSTSRTSSTVTSGTVTSSTGTSSTLTSSTATSSTLTSSTATSSSTLTSASETSTSATSTSQSSSTASTTSATSKSDTTVSFTVSSATSTATTLTGYTGPVVARMAVQGIDHSALTSDEELLAAFEEGVRQAVADETASFGIVAEYVNISLFPGSVVVEATVNVPDGDSVATLHRHLSRSPTLSPRIAEAVASVAGVAAATTGEVSVELLSVSAQSTLRAVSLRQGGEAQLEASANPFLVLFGGAIGGLGAGFSVLGLLRVRRRCLLAHNGARAEPDDKVPECGSPGLGSSPPQLPLPDDAPPPIVPAAARPSWASILSEDQRDIDSDMDNLAVFRQQELGSDEPKKASSQTTTYSTPREGSFNASPTLSTSATPLQGSPPAVSREPTEEHPEAPAHEASQADGLSGAAPRGAGVAAAVAAPHSQIYDVETAWPAATDGEAAEAIDMDAFGGLQLVVVHDSDSVLVQASDSDMVSFHHLAGSTARPQQHSQAIDMDAFGGQQLVLVHDSDSALVQASDSDMVRFQHRTDWNATSHQHSQAVDLDAPGDCWQPAPTASGAFRGGRRGEPLSDSALASPGDQQLQLATVDPLAQRSDSTELPWRLRRGSVHRRSSSGPTELQKVIQVPCTHGAAICL